MHTLTQTHTHPLTHTHTQSYTRTQVHTHTYAHTHIHAHTHTHTHTHTHSLVFVYSFTCIYVQNLKVNRHVLLSMSVVCVHSSVFFSFSEEKYVKGKSSASKISSRLLAYTYTCVLCTHVRICVCRDLVHLDFSSPAGVSSRLLGSHPSTRA